MNDLFRISPAVSRAKLTFGLRFRTPESDLSSKIRTDIDMFLLLCLRDYSRKKTEKLSKNKLFMNLATDFSQSVA